jgi:hypothetical protein
MFNDKGEIVPCREGRPTNNHYQDPYEALCFFTIATIAKGLPGVVFDKWLEELGNSARAQTADGTPFEKTRTAKFFEKLFNSFNLKEMKNTAQEKNIEYEEAKKKLDQLKKASTRP